MASERADLSRTRWIQTYSGARFRLDDLAGNEYRLRDIAHALANLCRYAGHCRDFYSVAQHSVLVSRVCDQGDAAWGLLHDASEAYLLDVPSPLKRMPGMEGYRLLERQVQLAVCDWFALPLDMPPSVHEADLRLLVTERRDLMGGGELWDPDLDRYEPLRSRIRPLPPREAEELFLGRAAELGIW